MCPPPSNAVSTRRQTMTAKPLELTLFAYATNLIVLTGFDGITSIAS